MTVPTSLPEEPQEVDRLQPALVILDDFLGSESQGWRLLRRLRADPMTRRIPILICTATFTEVRAREGDLVALSVRIVRKPFELDELLGVVGQTLETSRTGHAVSPVGSQDPPQPLGIIARSTTAGPVLPAGTVCF